ncbi:MAG: hypothetical protein EA409_07590 [Saprospirales bacterium]|nr:MAG: hypothetical protein EA409_07590 [Saprospirales bacterium]
MFRLFTIFLMFTFLAVNVLQSQSYDTPCEANDNPTNFGTGESSVNLNGNIEEVTPFITDLSGANVQNFGITDADSALFYKLNLDAQTSFLRISWEGGTVPELWVGLIGFEELCPAATEYGEFVYQNLDDEELLSDDIQGGEVIFELCRLDVDEGDFDNLFLWVASSEAGTFQIEVTQHIRPVNDGCESTPINLGTLQHGDDLEEDFSNVWACRQNFQPGSAACALEFNDGAAVWFEFTTGTEVGEINVLIENPDEVPVDVAIIENESGDCESFTLARRGCENGEDDEEILLEHIAVKPNTTYLIIVNTDPEDWSENFTITVSACDPPDNNLICDATALNFPSLGDYNPDNAINFPGGIGSVVEGTTECAYAFYNNDPTAENSWIDFNCGHAEVERAVFYKLNVDDYATKLYVEFENSNLAGNLAVQVFLVQALPGDCSDLIFDEGLFVPPAEWGSCNFSGGDVLEIDLCEVDNEDYGNLYLWVASAIDDEGEFELSFRQEIAPYNDLCEDETSGDRGAGDFGTVNWNFQNCFDGETTRGACPIPGSFVGLPACFDFFEDNPTVWYEFTTGSNVEAVDIEINFPGVDFSVAIFQLDEPCGTQLTAPGDWEDYCSQESGSVEFEQLRVKSNTTYYILVSTSEDDWGEFDICLEVCEAPENYSICEAEQVDFPAPGYNPNNPAASTSGTTECAYGFWNDAELTDLIEFDCGDEYEHAVLYKLNINEFASKIEIVIDPGTAGTMSAHVFFWEGNEDCDDRGFDIINFVNLELGVCDFTGETSIEIDFCPLWADPIWGDFEFHEYMYLWVATDLENQGNFNIDIFQEIAPYNDDCEDAGNRGPGDLGTIEVGDEVCELMETTRGACPILYSGPSACLEGFPEEDQAGVWFRFETGENVELLTIEVDHSNNGPVRMAMFELPDGCGETGFFPPNQDVEEYCVEATNGVDSIWNILVQENTEYFILVSTPIDDWGDFSICVRNCEPPENDRLCDVFESSNSEIWVYPGEESIDNGVYNRNELELEGTTRCASNFFLDFDLNFEDFGCGPDFESAVFYHIRANPNATEITVTGRALGDLNTLAFGFFSIGEEACDGDRNFMPEIWLDPEFDEMIDCNAAFDGEIVFDLCGLTDEEKENIFLWVATPRFEQGDFEIELSQKIGPVNDDCEEPYDFGVIESDEDEIICLEEINAPSTNLWGCAETYDPSLVDNELQYEFECFEDPIEPNISGVWYRFETDDEAGRLDMDFFHYSEGDEVRFVLFTPDPDAGEECEAWVIIMCEETEDGEIFFENEAIEPNTVYYMLFYSDKEIADDFDLCINVKPPRECLGIAPYYYNHTEIICGLSQLEGFCLFMGPPFPPSFINWPGCNPPFGVAFHNPQWFTFVAGEANQLSIDVEITECIGQGVQIAMYELDCNVEFDPSEQSPGIQPTADMLVSDCILTATPQIGIVNFTVNNVVPGTVYGIVVDGWANAVCKVEVLNVLVGGDPPQIDDDLLGEPEFDNEGYGFQPGDTICAGATDVLFALAQEVEGACTYRWTLNGEELTDLDDPLAITLDFPDPGVYEVCVSATNLCEFTAPKCIEVVVAPLDPDIQFDTICRRQDYLWEEDVFGIIDLLGPFDDSGDYEFEDLIISPTGCQIEAFLNLHVIPDNFDNPTELFEVICWDDPDPVYVPFEDHPQAQFFNFTGIYGEDRDLFITQEGSPGNEFECDSFFILELVNLDILFFFDEPFCLDSLIYIGGSDFVFPGGLEDFGYDAEIEIYYELIRESDDSIIISGTSIGLTDLFGGIFVELPVSEFFGEVQVFRVDFYLQYQGLPEEPCARSFSIEVDPAEFVPPVPEVDAPDIACIGDEVELEVTNHRFIPDETYVWSFSQQPDTIIGDPEGHQLTAVFSEAGIVEICVNSTNRCADSDPHCFEIDINEPPVTDAGPDGISCSFEHTFEGGGDDGFWTMVSSPVGATATFADNNDPQTTVTVSLKGSYQFMWTEVIGDLVGCRGRDTMSVQFLEIPELLNLSYECDSLGLEYVATFEILGETGPFIVINVATGEEFGTVDSNIFTSPPIPDLQAVEVAIIDGNGCESEVILLRERCDCPTAVGQLEPTALNLCDGECIETLDFYDDATQVFVPGQDTVLFFLQTTNSFSVNEDDWIDVNNHGVFCNEDLDVDIGTTYYVYVAVGPIDTLTGFIQLFEDPNDIDNCTRTARKPVTWRGQPEAMALPDTICGEVLPALTAITSIGAGSWSQVSGPGELTFDNVADPNSGVEADLCGTYTIQWREQNFQCVDSIQVDIQLNCIPQLGNVDFQCDNEDISYFLQFQIVSGTAPFTLVEPEEYADFLDGNVFTHPEMPNSGEELDIFFFVDANGCELEVVIDVNCDCQPFPGIMDDEQINVCITQTQVTAGPFQEDPEGEPGDIGTYVLHTLPGDQLGTILGINDNGVFNFNAAEGMVCGTIYYISYVVGPPDNDGNVDFENGCTRVAPGQPVLWYCEPTADAGDDVTVCGSDLAQLNGSSTFGTGQWSGGAGTLTDPDNPNTTYLPDDSEFAGTVTLTYTTFADDGICPNVSDQMVITVERPRVADAGPDQVFCEIEDVQLNADSEGVSGMWSGGAGSFNDPNLNNAVYTPDASEQGTTITLTWTTDAGNECPAVSDEMTIQIVDELVSDPGEDRIACFLSTQLEASLPGNLNGQWSGDAGVSFSDVNDPNAVVTVPSLGTFCFEWTISIGDCEDTEQVCITFVDAPEATWELECNDIATEYRVIFTISGGDQSTYTVNGTTVGGGVEFVSDWITSGDQVTFTIDDANGCDPFVVQIEHECDCLTEVGEMSDEDAVTLCEDQSFDFSVFYDSSTEFLDPNDIRVYLLHDGSVTDVGNIISQNTSGQFGFQAGMNLEQSYFVTVAVGDELGSTGTIDFSDACLLYSTGVEVIWYGYPDPGIELPAILTCAVTEVTITAVTPDADHISYQWSGPGIVSGQNERTVTVGAVGTYTLIITDTRAGCESTESVVVTGDFEEPDVIIEVPDVLTCAVTEVTVDGSGSSTGNMTYEWTGPGIVSGASTNTIVVSEIGNYTLTVIDNENGCSASASMLVEEDVDFPAANASVDAELDCSTDQVTLSGAGSSQGADFVYSWSVVPGTGGNLVGATDGQNATANQAGLYVIEVLNTGNECRSTDTVEVILIDDVVTDFALEIDGINCFGDRDGIITIAEVIGGTAPYAYSFDGGATFGTNNQVTGLSPGTYTIVVRDDRGCLHNQTVTLVEPPLLEVDLGPTIVVTQGESAVLVATVNVDEESIVEWNWDPLLDATCPNCPEQVFTPERETFVQIEVVDSSGCVANASVQVLVRVIREVYIPNAFSPNIDGINDFIGVYFDPQRINEIKEFRIFDRWGEQVFMRENIPVYTELNETNAWDGNFNGEPMQPGIFIYHIVIEFADGVEETFQGDFMLIR